MRDRLRKLILKSDILCDTCGDDTSSYCAEAIADYLLANGVIVLPCIVQHGGTHIKLDVNSEGKVIAESVFFSKEEAEQALRKEDEGK